MNLGGDSVVRILAWLLVTLYTALIWAAPLSAQGWSNYFDDDGSFFFGTAHSADYTISFYCGGRSAQGLSALVTGNTEPTTTDPGQIGIALAPEIIGDNGQWQGRQDIMFAIRDLGYQLPAVAFNDMDGSWGVQLSAGDPIFAALRSTLWLEVRSQNAAPFGIDTTALAPTYDALTQFCAQKFAAIGAAATAPQPAAPRSLRDTAEAFIFQSCGGQATAEPGYILTGDLDLDGYEDYVVDWAGITCPGQMARPFCGAAMCSADVFLSRRASQPGPHVQVLALGVQMQPRAGGGTILQLGMSLRDCSATRGSIDNCWSHWGWIGHDLIRLD